AGPRGAVVPNRGGSGLAAAGGGAAPPAHPRRPPDTCRADPPVPRKNTESDRTVDLPRAGLGRRPHGIIASRASNGVCPAGRPLASRGVGVPVPPRRGSQHCFAV